MTTLFAAILTLALSAPEAAAPRTAAPDAAPRTSVMTLDADALRALPVGVRRC
jgi:hypothetical protein